MARPRLSVYMIKKLSARRCYLHQRRDRDFWYMLQRSSVLAVAARINGETVTFGINYREALCSPLLLASTERLQFSDYIIKSPVLNVAACINSESAIFGKALGSPLLHLPTARQRFSVYIIKKLSNRRAACNNGRPRFSAYITKKLCAHRCCMQQWRNRDFSICHKEALCSPLTYTEMARRFHYKIYNHVFDSFTYHRNFLWHKCFNIGNRNPLWQSLLLYVFPTILFSSK